MNIEEYFIIGIKIEEEKKRLKAKNSIKNKIKRLKKRIYKKMGGVTK